MEHGAHTCLCEKPAISKLTRWKASKQHQHHLVFLTTEESLKREKEARPRGKGRAAQSKGTSVTLGSWGTIPKIGGASVRHKCSIDKRICRAHQPGDETQNRSIGVAHQDPQSVGGKTTLLLGRQNQPPRCLDLHPGLKREPRQALPP